LPRWAKNSALGSHHTNSKSKTGIRTALTWMQEEQQRLGRPKTKLKRKQRKRKNEVDCLSEVTYAWQVPSELVVKWDWIRIWFVSEKGGKAKNPQKNPEARQEPKYRFNPFYNNGSRIITQATLVEDTLITLPPLFSKRAVKFKLPWLSWLYPKQLGSMCTPFIRQWWSGLLSKVYIKAKWLFRLELIPVSVAWCD